MPVLLYGAALSNGDAVFLEPVYQSGTYGQVGPDGNAPAVNTYPNQCGSNANCVSLNLWQNWNALEAGWWSDNGAGGAGSGGLSGDHARGLRGAVPSA